MGDLMAVPTEAYMIRPETWAGCLFGLGFAILATGVPAGCRGSSGPAIMQLTEARQLAADLRVHFNKASDASNRAVMADTDEASIAFAHEAEQATQAVQHEADALAPLARGLDSPEVTRLLQEFGRHFAEYRALDHTVLELAVENTNLKAQRLSFGPAREAAEAFRTSLDALTRAASPGSKCRVESLVAGAVLAVRDIQVLHAPHIAESDDAAMTRMEKEMDGLEISARTALSTLSGVVEPASRPELTAGVAALDRFNSIHMQIIKLSRRNSNVRSLALALGQKRTLTTACDTALSALTDALAKEGFKATR